MIEAMGKYVGGKVVTAAIIIASFMVIVWYWNLPQESKEAIWGTLKGGVVWIGFAAIFPWATFFMPIRVVQSESNKIGVALLIGYLLCDILFAWYLCGWDFPSATMAQGVIVIGCLAAGFYNFLVCEFVAEKMECM